MDVRDTINRWTSHIDQCDFINEVMGEVLEPPIDQMADRESKVKEAYKKIHKLIKENQEVLINIDAKLIEKLADRVNSVGLYLNYPDPQLKEIYDLADKVRLYADKVRLQQMPRDIKNVIFDYAITTPESILKELLPNFTNDKPITAYSRQFLMIIQEFIFQGKGERAAIVLREYCNAVRDFSNAEQVLSDLVRSALTYVVEMSVGEGGIEYTYPVANIIEQIALNAPPRANEKAYREALQNYVAYHGPYSRWFFSQDFRDKYKK